MRNLSLAALLSILCSSAFAQFCPGVSPWVFDDVSVADPFCGYITWMAQNNITLGCFEIDANHRLYCPNDAVTRKSMAAFMSRLGNVRVQEVDTGPGLTGGPITQAGTIGLAGTQLLPTTACTSGQVPHWSGSAWACGSPGGGGTVTQVNAGIGLTGGPIVTTGTLSIAGSYQLPQGCSASQIAKWNGSAWACQADANSGGTVTSVTAGSGLTGGTITTSGTITVDPNSSALTSNFFKRGGNAFGAVGVLGTSDNNAVEIHVNGTRAVRYEPTGSTPNVLGGVVLLSGTRIGVTIAGGGNTNLTCTDPQGGLRPCANQGEADFVAIGGGINNVASGFGSVVAGGAGNTAGAAFSFVAGGEANAATGSWSVAMGRHANAGADGCFVFSDAVSANPTNCSANTFVARATGGVTFITSGTSQSNYNGLYVPAGGGSWVVFSDRNGKENFIPTDSRDVLERVAAMPIASWNWKAQDPQIRHLGPTAQDFRAAFGLGESEAGINTVDADGVALAAIQGLNAKLEERLREKDVEIVMLRAALEELRSAIARLAAVRTGGDDVLSAERAPVGP